jgi:hypothetical protein
VEGSLSTISLLCAYSLILTVKRTGLLSIPKV